MYRTARVIVSALAGLFVLSANSQNLTVQVGTPPAPPTPLVSHGDSWRYHKGTNAPVVGWQTNPDVSLGVQWLTGNGGIGFSADTAAETNNCLTILNDMQNVYRTLYMRRVFQISTGFDTNLHLLLRMDWDDGFVAYLDGVEVARTNAPGAVGVEPANTALATQNHESSLGSSGLPAVTWDLGAIGSRLPMGQHTLAILGLNGTLNSSDLIMVPDLSVSAPATGGTVPNNGLYAIASTNSVTLTGTNTIAGSARVMVNGDDAAFNVGAGTWTKTQILQPGMNRLFIAALDASGNILSNLTQSIVYEVSRTNISGTLPGTTTTWVNTNQVVHVTGTVTIPTNGTLMIGPGVVVIVAQGASINAVTNGVIMINGRDDAKTLLLPETTNAWGNLAAIGTNATLTIRHAEIVEGRVLGSGGGTVLMEDSFSHDVVEGGREIVAAVGGGGLTLRRSHFKRFNEVDARDTPVLIEDCLFEDFLVDGADIKATNAPLVVRRSTLRRADPTNLNADALDFGPGPASVEDCLIRDFPDKGVSIGGASGTTIRNTLIYRCGIGISAYASSNCYFDRVTISECAAGMYFRNNPTPAMGAATNFIVWGNTNNVVITNTSELTFVYSDIQGTTFPGVGNLSVDPLFVNPAVEDYSLQVASPCRGTGVGGTNMGVTLPVGGIPSEPEKLAALTVGTNFITLTWRDTSDNEFGFLIERSADAMTWQAIGGAGPNQTTFTDTNGLFGQKYYYRARASNSGGFSPFSNIASGTRQAAVIFVGGTISASTIWNAGVTVVVTSSVTIASGVTVTVQPGVQVQFNSGFSLSVANGGTLLAEGTTNAPILFTRNGGAGTWGHIVVNGGVGSPETRIAYARFEFNNTSPCIQVSGGTVFLDHLTFANTAQSYLHVDNASYLVQDCEFPDATAGFEMVHGNGAIKSGGRGIFVRNFFGAAIGYNDVVDITGGNRPGPIIHFINNVFNGASDDQLDLDGTDAWVEGNIFLHAHKNGSPDTASAVSGGDDSGATSEITVVGNIFYDCDHAAMAKGGNFYTFINNTVVHQTHAGGTDTDGAVLCLADEGFAQAAGIYAEANIIYDIEKLLRFYTNSITTFSNNLMPVVWAGPGGNNSTAHPQLKYIPSLSETLFTNWASAQIMREWFSVSNTSPAIGTGPNGRDRGGVIPIGASISGEPNGNTLQSNATLTVGFVRTGNGIPASSWANGSGYTHYKWRLDAGAWSAERPINSPIVLSNLSNGPHHVDVAGKLDSLLYQDDTIFGDEAAVTRSLTWIVGSGSTDSDGDGMPDDWEIVYGFNKNDPTDAALDSDGDGSTNLQEYLAGTNPRDGASLFAVRFSSPIGNALALEFDALANKSYTLLSRTSLSTGVWLPVQNFPAAATNRTIVVTTNFLDSARFFQILSSQ